MVSENSSSVLSMATKLSGKMALRDRLSIIVDQLRNPLAAQAMGRNTIGPDAKYPETKIVRAQITPLDACGMQGTSHAVKLKNFDKHGITFYHRHPICNRRALVSIESPQIGRFVAEVDLTWCRFSRQGDYTSGGRFVQLASLSA